MIRFEYPEGATPILDSSGLLPSWIQTMKDLNRAEAENIFAAHRKYLRRPADLSKWFNYGDLLQIHRTMFGKVWTWAGKIRRSITSIGVAPGLIPMHLATLCKEVPFNNPRTYIEKSARIHHRLVFIHPFENGNGRFSRLVADCCLLSWKCQYPIWPDSLHKEGSARKKYIESLQHADRGNFEPLILLMREWGARE